MAHKKTPLWLKLWIWYPLAFLFIRYLTVFFFWLLNKGVTDFDIFFVPTVECMGAGNEIMTSGGVIIKKLSILDSDYFKSKGLKSLHKHMALSNDPRLYSGHFWFFSRVPFGPDVICINPYMTLNGEYTPQYLCRVPYQNFTKETCVIELIDLKNKSFPGLTPTVEQYAKCFAYNPINSKQSIDVEKLPVWDLPSRPVKKK